MDSVFYGLADHRNISVTTYTYIKQVFSSKATGLKLYF